MNETLKIILQLLGVAIVSGVVSIIIAYINKKKDISEKEKLASESEINEANARRIRAETDVITVSSMGKLLEEIKADRQRYKEEKIELDRKLLETDKCIHELERGKFVLEQKITLLEQENRDMRCLIAKQELTIKALSEENITLKHQVAQLQQKGE